jgi:hypothetical protein
MKLGKGKTQISQPIYKMMYNLHMDEEDAKDLRLVVSYVLKCAVKGCPVHDAAVKIAKAWNEGVCK